MKKLLVIWLMLLSMMAYAYDFEKDGIYYNITSLQNLTVDVTSGDNPYSGNITIPESVIYADKVFKVTGIAERGFANSGITGINLPNTITDLKIEAFAGCYNLVSLSIPGSVTSFQRGVLLGCYNLSDVRIEDSDNSLHMSMVTIYSNGYSSFRDCNLKSVYVGRSLTSGHNGDQGIFSNHKELTKVEFGEKIEAIAGGMFYLCTGIEKIVFSKNIKSIGWSAFYGCTSLCDVYLNEGLEIIGGEAFRGCKQLKSIVLPSTLNSIETNVFYDATSINSIVCKATVPPTIYESTFAGITYLNAILHVPTSTESLYKEASGWKDFVNITESGLYKLTYLIDNEFYKSYELEYDAAITPEAAPTKEGYTFSGWSEIPETMPAYDVTVTGTFTKIVLGKCATPTIAVKDGKLTFSCETEGVKFKYDIQANGSSSGEGNVLDITPSYAVKVYATKDLYEDSDVATATIKIIKGDVNDDGEVDIADAVKIVNLVVGKIPALARPAKEVKDEKVPQ